MTFSAGKPMRWFMSLQSNNNFALTLILMYHYSTLLWKKIIYKIITMLCHNFIELYKNSEICSLLNLPCKTWLNLLSGKLNSQETIERLFEEKFWDHTVKTLASLHSRVCKIIQRGAHTHTHTPELTFLFLFFCFIFIFYFYFCFCFFL